MLPWICLIAYIGLDLFACAVLFAVRARRARLERRLADIDQY